MSSSIGLEEGWGILEEGIAKAKRILEGHTNTTFTAEEYVKYYSCVYMMSVRCADCSQELYERYRWTLEHCISSMVLPYLVDKHQDFLLQVLIQIWSNYNLTSKLLSGFFSYLDHFYTKKCIIPPLKTVACNTFFNLVLQKYNDRIRDAVISLVNREREGDLINRDLVRSVMCLILDAGMGITSSYKEFEWAIVEDACAYYCRKASEWVWSYSLADYSLKVKECLKSETDRLQYYFVYNSDSSRKTLLQTAWNQLMSLYQDQLKMQQPDGHLAIQNYQAISEELLNRWAGLTLSDRN